MFGRDRRIEAAVSWVRSTEFPNPVDLGAVELAIIERIAPELVTSSRVAPIEPGTLGKDERAVVLARTRALDVLRYRGVLSAERATAALRAPIGSWSNLD